MLIGITGAAGSGKRSAAEALCAGGWQSISIDDALRTEVAAAWHVDQRLLSDRSGLHHATPSLAIGGAENPRWLAWADRAELNLTAPRSPAWLMGVYEAWREHADSGYWMRPVLYWINYRRQHGQRNLVVIDVATSAQAVVIRFLGGKILRVHRPDLARVGAAIGAEIPPSPKADADVHNDADLPSLAADMWRVVQQLSDE